MILRRVRISGKDLVIIAKCAFKVKTLGKKFFSTSMHLRAKKFDFTSRWDLGKIQIFCFNSYLWPKPWFFLPISELWARISIFLAEYRSRGKNHDISISTDLVSKILVFCFEFGWRSQNLDLCTEYESRIKNKPKSCFYVECWFRFTKSELKAWFLYRCRIYRYKIRT